MDDAVKSSALAVFHEATVADLLEQVMRNARGELFRGKEAEIAAMGNDAGKQGATASSPATNPCSR